ncbi:hypothetical protein KIPB_007196, partial [Kipferlia bialata]|eukprot:g7196.t1
MTHILGLASDPLYAKISTLLWM